MIRRLAGGESLEVLEDSIAESGEFSVAALRLSFEGSDDGERLLVSGPEGSKALDSFSGERRTERGEMAIICPRSSGNLAALREALPHLKPRPLGLATSAGFGDRLGLATPGHVAALREAGDGVAPIFAQQSIREMERTNRSAQEVLDDAVWGVFTSGWREPHGADADHLKTSEDIDVCVAAGYTFFTFDPGEYVNDRADVVEPSVLRELLDALPWDELEDSSPDFTRRYSGLDFAPEGHEVAMDEETMARAAVKYGRAVAHAVWLYRHLLRSVVKDHHFEVEVSVDETESPTTHAQHLYIATELSRLGVPFVSLAPRYVGGFEKGVDYLGNISRFEEDIAVHAAIARAVRPEEGSYKLSLHSGSDKFSVYEPAVRQTRGLVHLKTAGTSYLEALRTAAALDPGLFREIYTFARERYEEDRASYHVSAELSRAEARDLADRDLPALLDRFDEREILHVTFGSVLRDERLRGALLGTLQTPEGMQRYTDDLRSHFNRHLAPFSRNNAPQTGD